MEQKDIAGEQLSKFKQEHQSQDVLTTSSGNPIGLKTASLTAGKHGPVLLQDFTYIDEIAHFDRERIPERVVHAKGGGAHGEFEVTHDITKYCKASVFEHLSKKTPVFVRFSTVGGESGSADTARDPRGFAVKFYTDDGNWDLVGNNTPIFFIRDPILFPSFIHTQKRNPKTHLKDPDMFWDFISLRPETVHQVSILFSDRGTPDGFRHMHGYGSHTFKMVNKNNESFWCKFHWKTAQGIKNLSAERAAELSALDPDYSIRDLYNAIGTGDFPKWNLFLQIIPEKETEGLDFNPFDVTKVWPQGKYPLIPVGTMTLNRNPDNYFAEVEQAAFAPSHMVPGIEPSPDKMLQGRLFSYPDTHRHRLGVNYQQLPINRPRKDVNVRNYQRDGSMCSDGNQGGAPNYFPNSFNGPDDNLSFNERPFNVSGIVTRFNTMDEDNFSQTGIFWSSTLNEEEKLSLVNNIAGHLKDAKPEIRERVIKNFSHCHPQYGKSLREKLSVYMKKGAAKL